VAERVLTLRELNRASLARQLLLERKRLSPAAVIERLVGMQAQWPQAPYVGIWTRTTSFRRKTLERDLANATIVKATVMRQTLHLVTRRDYGLIRAAMSETNFPWESSVAKRLAPAVRALCDPGPVTRADGIAYLEREHGLTGVAARRAWGAARRASAPTSCTTTRRRSGKRGRRAGSRRSRSRTHMTRRRLARRCFGVTSRRSGRRRAATSLPGR
jgi:DNA glycosylase AlkZ-like